MAGHAGSWRGRPIPVLIVVLVAAAGLAGCTRGADRDRAQASISVTPQAALVDQPVAVTVQGLPPEARTTLAATAKDTDGSTWSATAQFKATSAGEVSLGQPSLGGSYTGVNPMGLFTLMAPPPGSAPDWFLYPEAGYDVTLQATVGGRVVAEASVRRQVPSAVGVVERRLRPTKDGIYGNLYLPRNTAGKHPAVLVFGGSGGGLTTSSAAALLAAHGYPSLALAYFKAPGLPQSLHNLPLEYFTSALKLLRAQPGWIPAMSWLPGSRGAAKPRCCSAPTSPSWSTASSPACPARW
jgi:Acyl-CoA thioester hydrolase/BAAT N-terminal region